VSLTPRVVAGQQYRSGMININTSSTLVWRSLLDTYNTMPAVTPVLNVTNRGNLIGNNFAITTPTYSNEVGEVETTNSKARANFLMALWKSWRNVGQKDPYFDLVFNQIVRGRSALQVAWIAKTGQSDPWRPPVLFRSLNPKNVGYLHDDVSLVCAYNTYDETIRKLRLRYPDIVSLQEIKDKDKTETVTFTDFWYRDPKSGKAYNCYLINNREMLRPMT
jgi:hypothetical protein